MHGHCNGGCYGIRDVSEGDEVIQLGGQKNTAITALELAERAGTIPYEILTSLGNRSKRYTLMANILLKPVEVVRTFESRCSGALLCYLLQNSGSIMLFLCSAVKQLGLPPFGRKNNFKQVVEIGIKSLPVVLITAVFTGMVLALQSYTGFKRFNAEGNGGNSRRPFYRANSVLSLQD